MGSILLLRNEMQQTGHVTFAAFSLAQKPQQCLRCDHAAQFVSRMRAASHKHSARALAAMHRRSATSASGEGFTARPRAMTHIRASCFFNGTERA